ncbi:ATP-binding cassette domain-containing protein [Jonesiaceae bacterium BS-20]|uniref:ATP-binding cassette domain-containing protein n=1 Tax=Jonesiaceae bacterium BS-20 TaxID=3120821 RepID=A0AAU7DV75_9MICO
MITLDHVSKTFTGKAGTVHALDDVSLQVNKSDVFGIIGFSGAGKSTLIRLVNQLESPDTGTVVVAGQDLTTLSTKQLRTSRRSIGMVFQQFNLLETKTVFRNIAMPLILAGASKAEIAKRVDEVLEIVELTDKRGANIRQLSGGQKQRVGIARALATHPDILLCDEATSALDPKTTESILALLKKINREMGVTILLITHQMQVIQRICNRVAVMEQGRIVEQGAVIDVFGQPQREITQDFVRTVINDQVPGPMAQLVQAEARHYRVERLRFIGKAVQQPIISTISKIEGLEVNVLGANVEELQETVLCLYLLQLIGPDHLIDQAEHIIDQAGVLRERVNSFG